MNHTSYLLQGADCDLPMCVCLHEHPDPDAPCNAPGCGCPRHEEPEEYVND